MNEELARQKYASLLRAIGQRLIAACDTQRDDIGDSDLDDEQPITLNVSLELGDIRKLRRWQHLASSPPQGESR